MNIKISHNIEIPDGLICAGRRDCAALYKDLPQADRVALCANFNRHVFWSGNSRFYVKCRACINASLDYLEGVTK